MKFVFITLLLVLANVANATSSKPLAKVVLNDKLLVVGKDGNVNAQTLGDLARNSIVLVRSECMQFDGNFNKFIQVACLVKTEFGSLSIKDEVVVE